MRILYVEPFDGGSHATFTRTLRARLRAQWTTVTWPGRHWKWHMRVAAAATRLDYAEALAVEHDVLLASSYTPLAELVGLAPRLAAIPRALYFHENQLAYPPRAEGSGERDLHYGVTQLVSALAADVCLFNSDYNRRSFLDEGRALLQRMPEPVPMQWIDEVVARSEVVGFPLDLPDEPPPLVEPDRAAGPVIAWNHRWEHDKDPESFFAALRRLADAGLPFRVLVCGEQFRRAPAVFAEAPGWLGDRIVHFGWLASRAEYLQTLGGADIAVSTARHEFFGVSMLEASHLGAYPLVPDRLVYPELFDAEHRYADGELVSRLETLCRRYVAGEDLRADRRAITRPHLATTIVPAIGRRLQALVERGPSSRLTR